MTDLGPAEIRLMQGLAQRVTAVAPELLNGEATVGELAWSWGRQVDLLGQFWRHRFWVVDDQLAGWGWAVLPYQTTDADGKALESTTASLIWQVHPDQPELLGEILDWYDEVAGNVDRLVTMQSADAKSLATVAEHGYVFDEESGGADGSWIQFNMRELTDLPDPVLPKGFRFVSAEDVSVADAVEAHRAAWPKTRLTVPTFERVRQTWPYRAELHVLVQAPDGTLVASAITWLDELTRTAEFEPVGTHVAFRRQGLGSALQLYGMHLARAAGADRMLVACHGAAGDTAARDMYYGVGFRQITRDMPQIKVAR